jgi:hypothetical protein
MIRKRCKYLFLLAFILTTILPTHGVLADTGPKPSMTFTFTGEPVTVVSGVLYECQQADCSDAAPLEELGPQRFYCDAEGCSAIAYGFAPYHQIEIEFSDGVTRESNIFETAGFDSEYTVTVQSDGLLVEAQFSLSPNINPVSSPRIGISIVLACACLLVAGSLLVAGVIFFIRRRSKS